MNRDRKIEMWEAFKAIRKAADAINGPYNEQSALYRAVDEAQNVAIDDEVHAGCEGCSEPIFVSEDDYTCSDDGVYICGACIKRYNEQAA